MKVEIILHFPSWISISYGFILGYVYYASGRKGAVEYTMQFFQATCNVNFCESMYVEFYTCKMCWPLVESISVYDALCCKKIVPCVTVPIVIICLHKVYFDNNMQLQYYFQLYGRLNKYGICLDKTKKYTIQDEIGNHFIDKVVEQVKAGKKFTFVLDNIDWDLKVHEMRSDNQNRSVHAVATTLLFDRVSSNHLPDEEPQQSLSKCDIAKTVSMTDGEAAARKQRYKIFAARILCEFIPAFSFLKNIAHVHLQSNYKDKMDAKSVVVPFPVVMKDEKKYAEVVDVLDQLETWIHEIYSQAGLLLPVKVPDTLPLLPASLPGSSRPDQPLSHVRPVVDATDPLAGVKVPCFGDQLTRVRFAGAKDLRAGSHNARDRLDHIYPIRIADWHCKRSFLKVQYVYMVKRAFSWGNIITNCIYQFGYQYN